MAEYLFITPTDLKSTTVLGGNVDEDKYLFCVADIQITLIERLLGTELYDKIKSEADAGTITGDYETILNEYVKPITKHAALANYIKIANFQVGNGGVFKNAPDQKQIVEADEIDELAERYRNMADVYVLRFNKWICKNSASIPEYKLEQDDVNASRDISNSSGWWLGKSGLSEDELMDIKMGFPIDD